MEDMRDGPAEILFQSFLQNGYLKMNEQNGEENVFR